MTFILGTAQLGASYGVLGRSVQREAQGVEGFLRRARSVGITAVDTAPAYPCAEDLLGASSVAFEIHTKIGKGDPRESLEGSLRRLRVNTVQIAYLHDPEAIVSDARYVDLAWDAITGRADRLGASVYSSDALEAAIDDERIGAVQLPVNPLYRSVAEVARVHRRRNCLTFGRSLFAQGLIAVDYQAIPQRVQHLAPTLRRFHRLCVEMDRSPVEVSLLWARDHSALDGLIIGAVTLEELDLIGDVLKMEPLSHQERMHVEEFELESEADFDPRYW